MMQVICFIIKRPLYNPININIVHKEFGTNIPKYNALEGGDYLGPEYLCCVDTNVNVKSICNKYNYVLSELYKMNIDSSKYNSNYIVRKLLFCSNNEHPYILTHQDEL